MQFGVINYDLAVYTFAVFGVIVLARFIYRELRRRRRRQEWMNEARDFNQWWGKR